MYTDTDPDTDTGAGLYTDAVTAPCPLCGAPCATANNGPFVCNQGCLSALGEPLAFLPLPPFQRRETSLPQAPVPPDTATATDTDDPSNLSIDDIEPIDLDPFDPAIDTD